MVLFVFVLLSSFAVAERYIVEVAGDVKLDNVIDSLTGSVGAAKAGIKGVATTKKIVVEAEEEELLENEDVIFFEQDYQVELLDTPWNYEVIGLNFDEVGGDFGEGVKIAVLDTGADFGLLDVISGYDFVNEDEDASDDNGHGNFLAQILRRPGDNKPLTGVEVYAVKVIDGSGVGFISDIIEGIDWAVANDMDIVLMSFGGEDSSVFFEEAVDAAYDSGVLLIASIGNGDDDFALYPAGYDSVIAVGSVNQELKKSDFSNYGRDLELMAPGENILVTDGVDWYSVAGTSFCTPHAGIAAADFFSQGLNNELVREALHRAALDLGEKGRDDVFGWGLVQVGEYDNSDYGNLEERVGLIELALLEIQQTLSEMLLAITGLVVKTDEHEIRISNLENKPEEPSAYFNYLSSSDRKKIVCGYAEDNRLESFIDLGWNCTLTYKIYSSGRESVRCRCGRV